ncbi:NAD(P)H-dependent oxidoreductase [Leptonema illini]|uniref:NAD(P)H dehydrogenase (Quinone) n=1 Tax=Leptonema illini DSM 21528 TaxID=929563 RepID=H2C9Z8_9LEPT|nr:NAD(P)H-dependent oxidoreductase [Leptonema illini]EHQ05122.1 NAD(P)H dehydrogenase (quinone) [Leptonema illini DSM 21528]
MASAKKILLILGHPDPNSFNGAIFQSIAEGFKSAQSTNTLQAVRLADLHFQLNLAHGYNSRTELEPDLLEMQTKIKEADHIVFVYPTWWGQMPALLKGFFDRVFLPGFAFKYRENSPLWDKFLTGKTGDLIVTMDAPSWYDRLLYGAASRRAVKNAILEFCGIKPVRITTLDRLRYRKDKERAVFLEKMKKLGASLASR